MNDSTFQLNPTGSPTRVLNRLWTVPFVAILLAHFMMDAFSGMIPASLGLMQSRWNLADEQGAWLLGLGALCSGLAQPFFAWISDRTGNRIYGGLGLVVAGVLLSSLGLAASAFHLFMFYAFGMIGNGMFHPIAASTIGQLNPSRRSFAISCFFVAGMVGGISGATFGPRILATENGFDTIRLAAIPAILIAFFLHWNIRKAEHRVVVIDETGNQLVQENHWGAVAILYCSASLRFFVNLALVYLYVRWVESVVAIQNPESGAKTISKLAAPMVGNMNAAAFAGMACGGLASGILVPRGKEKWPYIVLPLVFAPCIGLVPIASPRIACLLAAGAGFGFAIFVPVTIAMAQRLMPGRTSLASGLMMGGAWAFAMFGPVFAEWLIANHGIQTAFIVMAGITGLSGSFVIGIKSALISGSVG